VKILLYTAILMTVMACTDQRAATLETLDKEFKKELHNLTGKHELKADIYIVIPRAGCGGCISDSEKYLLDFLNKKRDNRIKFILTDFASEKILRARFGSHLDNDVVLVDKESLFGANQDLKSIYPTVYMFKGGNLADVSSFSPERNAANDVNQFLIKL
jgi:hypothetical protein